MISFMNSMDGMPDAIWWKRCTYGIVTVKTLEMHRLKFQKSKGIFGEVRDSSRPKVAAGPYPGPQGQMLPYLKEVFPSAAKFPCQKLAPLQEH